jgi:hypothetical protein
MPPPGRTHRFRASCGCGCSSLVRDGTVCALGLGGDKHTHHCYTRTRTHTALGPTPLQLTELACTHRRPERPSNNTPRRPDRACVDSALAAAGLSLEHMAAVVAAAGAAAAAAHVLVCACVRACMCACVCVYPRLSVRVGSARRAASGLHQRLPHQHERAHRHRVRARAIRQE